MKKINILLALILVVSACKQAQKPTPEVESEFEVVVENFAEYGADLTADNFLEGQAMMDQFDRMQQGDTLQTAFKSKVVKVCQARGCWMELELPGGETTMVRFKDYGFFVPKDIAGREVWVEGKAFVEETSVATQQHLARDAGASEEEVSRITETKQGYNFEATGVRVSE